MAARAMWKGVLRFGSVRLPVKLYSAVKDQSVHFHLHGRKSGKRVRQRWVNPRTGEQTREESVRKGYEIEPGTFVVIHPKELESVEPPPSRDILTMAFIPPGKIGPQWYERPYYLGPDGDSGAYFAFLQALDSRNRVGIVQWVMRKRQYFGALRAEQGCLALFSLRNTEEVLSSKELPAPGVAAAAREVRMAEQLIQALEGEFRPEDYRDEYRERLRDYLEKKAKGHAPRLKPLPKTKPPASTLDALEASLKAVRKGAKAAA
jgi:DNA end-binding protein Ku